MLAMYGTARSALLPPEHPVWAMTKAFAERWEDYKTQTNSMAFTDLLVRGCAELLSPPSDPRILMVDEAQDLTPMQWQLVRLWAESVERLVVVGDPAQCLYGFLGASPKELLTPLAPERQRLLGTGGTYRMPRVVHQYAERWLRTHSAPMCDDRDYQSRDADGKVRHLARGCWPR